MTVIVGIEHNGKVVMGGDSAGVSGLDVTIRADEKVFINGPFLMGFTSSFRMGQLLRYALDTSKLKLPHSNADLPRFMAVDFVNAIRKVFKDGGYGAHGESASQWAGTFLVGVRGVLFSIDSDYQVGRSRDGYDAVGCGEFYAKGALFSNAHLDPTDAVLNALDAAAHFSGGVAGPFTILEN